MDENKDKARNPLSSMLPLILMFVVVFFVMRQFQGKDEKAAPGPVAGPKTPSVKTDAVVTRDFEFARTRGAGRSILVHTKAFTAELTENGGRISAFYVRSHDELQLPQQVVAESKDPRAKQYNALEVTKHNGMDFQPHLWWKHPDTGDYWQIADPPLNSGAFRMEAPLKDEKTGVQEVRFHLPVRFRGSRFEIVKVFRFFPREHFFRQITMVRNLEARPFTYHYLYFKAFGDIGPPQETADTRLPATRFYRYGGDLFQNTMTGKAAGCGLGCGHKEDVTLGRPNSLEFVGSTSRYFFAYSRFLAAQETPVDVPDGLILVKRAGDSPEHAAKEGATTYFENVALASARSGMPDLGGPGRNRDASGAISKATGNARILAHTRVERPDALIIDNQVFVGLRTDESHSFRDVPLLEAEFGADWPSKEAREALFSSSYFKLFSKIKDFIVWLMRQVYRLTGNYGWAIIIVAVSFKLITWPLNQMQAKSMKKMSALKPELDAMNEKYAEDPQEKQKQLMELYKRHQINPAKGCLPVLIQMPIFVALFSAFSEAIELWKSPFILWMTDLSQPDTIGIIQTGLPMIGEFHMNILPLLMVGSQILYQRFTTMTADPQQKMLMYLMPVVFMFMFWSMPSGVTLYWTLQNVFSIVWQIAANRLSDDVLPVPTPAAARTKRKGKK